MASLTLNGTVHQVEGGRNLLQVILELGADLPYFCWHPALGSIGACRQCAVRLYKDDKDEHGRIVMACMTPVADGQRVDTEDEEARAFRAAIIEWLMTNHPHDCPICDEGGECHLQDMTVMTGHAHRRTRFNKRTFRNQDLGPFINHEMNRCIQCYRCVRFYADFAGGRDLAPFASRNRVWFGRAEPGKLESPFSGNLVEVCPTGVFTDKPLKAHYTRKWDLQSAPSVCVHCSLGCNVLASERYGLIRRILNRYHGQVNGYFLCDRGRFGYGFANRDDRIRRPLLREGPGLVLALPDEALAAAAKWLAPGAKLVGIGSPRASLESNFMLRRLVGAERFCNGLSPGQARLTRLAVELLAAGPARPVSLRELERADAVLVLGEDLVNTAPMAALALRQSVRVQPYRAVDRQKIPRWDDFASRLVIGDRRGPLFVAGPRATWTDALATATARLAPDDAARLGYAVAHRLDETRPEPGGLDADQAALADRIAEALHTAERPAIVAGTSLGSEALVRAAASVAAAACSADQPAGLFMVLPEANAAGAAMIEPAGLERALGLAADGIDALVVLENDLARRLDPASLERLLGASRHVLVLDHSRTRICERADLLLPAGSFAEASGTLVNNEGRAQRFFRVHPPGDEVDDGWRWLARLGRALGREGFDRLDRLDEALAALAADLPRLARVVEAAPPADHREHGQRVPRQPHRYTGRTSMQAHLQVSEPKPTEDEDGPLAFSMEGYPWPAPASLTARYWAPGWNSVQALNRYQEEIGAALKGGDPGVRLFDGAGSAARADPGAPPEAFSPREGALLIVAAHHLFGSEELSARAEPIAEVTPPPELAIGPEDARALGCSDGDRVTLTIAGQTWSLELTLDPDLPRGVAAAPVGLPGQPAFDLPAWGEVARP